MQISPGLNGPVDFHQMTVSPADPETIYGAYGGLQRSRDGGKTWSAMGPTPEGQIDLAASSTDADTIYAATEAGLLFSGDAGSSWSPLLEGAPVSMVEVTPDGRCSFVHFECLGACEQAPMMMVDDTYHGRLEPEDVRRIVGELD